MNAFTDDVKKIGIPTIASNARFQIPVTSMDVFSNFSGIAAGTKIETGNIEFWPDNYGAVNAAKVAGASDSVYDFGDEAVPPADGYGSMQVHNHGAGQTLFAINHWGAGAGRILELETARMIHVTGHFPVTPVLLFKTFAGFCSG